jgi:hypothetical protein
MKHRTPSKTSKRQTFFGIGLRGLLLVTGIVVLLVSGISMLAAPSNPAISLDQASNGGIGKTPISPVGWENGNQNGQKAHYNEGESIPYRARITSLTAGQTYRATFGYDITHSSKHAIDYITSNQRIAEIVDPCDGTGEPVISPCAPGIPGQINAPGGAAGGFFTALVASEGAQYVKIYNGDISAVEYITQGNEAASQSETTFRVTFTVAAGATQVVLSWGGHIARSADWGPGQAATGISGSPYHTRAKSLDVPNGSGGFNTISIGNQDRALASSAVQPPAACSLSNDGQRACGSSNFTHALVGAATVGTTYAFEIISGQANATIAESNVDPTSTGCTDGDPTTPCIYARVTATGSYTIKLTASNPAGTETCQASVTVDETPVAAAGNDQEHCNQGALSDKDFTVDSTGSSVPATGTLTWSVLSGDATIASPNAASTKVTVNTGTSATIRLTVAGPAGTSCTAATDDVVLTLDTPPTVSISLENECNAGTADLKANASGGSGTLHYQWQKDGANVGSDSSTLPVSALGTYSVTVTDGKSCVAAATKKLCFSLQNAP